MTQQPPQSTFANRFTVPGKLQTAPKGSNIIAPVNSGTRLIINFVSQQPDKFDRPLDKILERVWKTVRTNYFAWTGDLFNFKMGHIKDTLVASDIMVISLLVRNKDGIIDSSSLEKSLQKLAAFSKENKGSVHISEYLISEVPALKELVKKYIADTGINCYFYDLPENKR